MNRLKICFFPAFIFFMNPSPAQEKELVSIQWSRAASLPDFQDGKASIGLAGAVIGLSNGYLLVAGGANFPEGMPWEGGKKKYYSGGIIYKMEERGKNKSSGGSCLSGINRNGHAGTKATEF